MKICTNGEIKINGLQTGLHVTQLADCTVVYSLPWQEHKMPHTRYSLVSDEPASGVPGKTQFKQDVIALMRRLYG